MYNQQLKTRILKWMEQASTQPQTAGFDALALDLWADQIERNPEYGRWSDWVLNNSRPTHWQDIPAVPVTLFRDLTFTCFPPMLARHRFRTSGTTGPRGCHRLLDTEVYDRGSVLGRDMIIGTVPTDGVSLVSSSAESSLGHMCRYFAPTMHQCFIPELGVLKEEAFALLRSAETPQFIPATAFAMASLLRDVNMDTDPIELMMGSVILITGGFKGRTQEIEGAELIKRLRHLFPTATIVGEYGMTELSSQMWSHPLEGRFFAPPWLKVVAVDPKTGLALPNGTVGQLKFVDLANHQTVLAIETRDQGIVHPDGSMELLGRLPQSDARGCSLSVEEVDRFFVQQTKAPTEITSNSTVQNQHHNPRFSSTVLQALRELQSWDNEQIQAVCEGLSAPNAQWGWHNSLSSLLEQNGIGFNALLDDSPHKPEHIGIVLARGVFTAGLEWVALALASGARVTLKVPRGLRDSIERWGQVFQRHGLPLHIQEHRNLPSVDWLWIFGDDDSIHTVQQNTVHAFAQTYGHRFSIALSSDSQQDAEQVAQDIVAYDTRGCMAPVAVCCTGNAQLFSERLFEAMRKLQQERPLGAVDPFLGPEFRRRIGLSLQHPNSTWLEKTGQDTWGVLLQPVQNFTPSALPRLTSVHATPTPDVLEALLAPWNSKLSTIGCSNTIDASTWLSQAVLNNHPRICTLGEMQRPPFVRLHDGVPMWGPPVSVHTPNTDTPQK